MLCEVKLKVSHHALAKPLVFVLDPPKDDREDGKKKRRSKRSQMVQHPKTLGQSSMLRK